MPTIDDLRRQLADDAATVPESRDRLARVHHRVSVRRRQRAAGAGLAAVAVLVGAAAILPQLGQDADRTVPGGPTPTGGLPEYQSGGRLVAQATHNGGDAFTVPFTADSRKLMFAVDCFVAGIGPSATDMPMAKFSIDGVPIGGSGCGGSKGLLDAPSSMFTPDPEVLAELTPGQPAVMQVAIDRAVPASSRVRVGVYESVPVAEYPFPPQPDPLPSLESLGNLMPELHPRRLLLVSPSELPSELGPVTPADTNGTFTRTLTVRDELVVDVLTAAPGRLTIEVDGKVVSDFSSWNYGQSGYGDTLTLEELGIPDGGPVTLTLKAERFPGPSWAVLFSDGK